jgi:3',5'-cyclic AMP phosphodiesterase CpdA
MSVLIQISDTHFGTERAYVVDALLQFVTEAQPEILVLSGDITQRARRRQFRSARRFVDQLRVPDVISLPGNHDIPLFNLPARLFSPYGNYKRAFGSNLEPCFELAAFMVIGVNTTRPRRHVDGEVSPEQIGRVSDRLRTAAAGQIRIVVTHQPVHVIRASDEKNLLHGHEAAVRRWAHAGADIIMGGHIHLPYVRPLSDRFHDLPRRIWSVQAGTAVSHRVRHGTPNSINLIRHTTAEQFACVVERWDYGVQERRFVLAHSDRLELDRAG